LEYDVFLTIGEETEIRDIFYGIREKSAGADAGRLTGSERYGAGPVRGWEFTHAAPGIAWRPVCLDFMAVTNGVLRGVFSDHNSAIETDPLIHLLLNADDYSRMDVRIRNESASGRLQLRFNGEEDSSWSSDRLLTLPISAASPDFKTYELDLSSHTAWRGSIRQLRLNLLDAAEGAFEIEHIVLYSP
jgi:hypothetical protein